MNFADLGLCDPLLKAIADIDYSEPSPIQQQAIGPVLEHRDLMAAAQTGTGKTAAFGLPILHMLRDAPRAQAKSCYTLILTPTRELAAQISDNVQQYSKYMKLRSTVVFGGVKINPQISKLAQGSEIVIATPGRLLDLHRQGAIHFDQLKTLVLDEADRMLDMGFIHDIRRILKLLPEHRQNLLFSATFSEEIRSLAKRFINDPVEVSVAPRNSTAEKVDQWLVPVDKSRKTNLLIDLIKAHGWFQVLVFTRTKHGANRLTTKLEKAGIQAAAIHGNKSQNARTRALADFKAGTIQALVATDIAARGIDIDQLPQVVNFDLPNVAEDYVHRIGRTGRAGASGTAVSLVSADEIKQLKDIEKLTRQTIERRPRAGFEPQESLPESGSKGNGAPRRRRRAPNHNGNGNGNGNSNANRNRGNGNRSRNNGNS